MPEALYRKYRPQVFSDVVGQESIERTLKNSIEQNKVSHAYMFTGPRGTGKTTMARILAKALLCESGPTTQPDNTCEDCRLITAGVHPDVYELDAASRTGVENVREEIIGSVNYAPTRGRSKVYIIDEVHMLSTAAFNALLKTLEEPPANVVFILCTTDPQKVPETIRSRCQCFGFKRIAPEAMVSRLGAICVAENVEFEGEALDLIAQRAEGGLRNALTSLEQIIAYENGKVTLAGAERLLGSIDSSDMSEIMAYVGSRDVASCFRWVADYVESGADLAQFVRDMSEHVRDLYILALAGDEAVLEVSDATRISLTNELAWFGADRASRMLGVLGDLSIELKTSSNQRLSFEIALTRMVRPDSDLTLEALAERIEMLEMTRGTTGSASVPSEAPARHATATIPQQGKVVQAANKEEVAAAAVAQAVENLVEEVIAETLPVEAAQASLAETGVADAPELQDKNGPTEQASDAPSSSQSPFSNAAVLQRTWQAALSELKRTQQAHSVLFNGVRVSYDPASGDIILMFSQQSTFAYSAAQKPEIIQFFENHFKKATGEDAHFVFKQASAPATEVQRVQPAVQPVAHSATQQERPFMQAVEQARVAPVETEQPQASPLHSDSSSREQASEPEHQQQSQQGFEHQAEPSTAVQPESASVAHADDADESTLSENDRFDEVPLSLYEDDTRVAYEQTESAFESAEAEEDSSVVQEEDESSTKANTKESQTPDEDADQLRAMLQLGFGADVTIEEV